MNNPETVTALFETSLGWMTVTAGVKGIEKSSLPEPDPEPFLAATEIEADALYGTSNELLERTRDLLIAYCAGEDVGLDQIPIEHGTASEFTKRIREACRQIPRGEIRSYGWLAQEATGSPKAARAAGRAMATNPLPLLVPCHRVIGSDGKLHGFGGSQGLSLKALLLEMEGANLN